MFEPDTTRHKELTSRGLKYLEFAAYHAAMVIAPKALAAMLLEIARGGDYPHPPDSFTRTSYYGSLLDGTAGDGGELVDDAELLGADVAEGWVLAHLSDNRPF